MLLCTTTMSSNVPSDAFTLDTVATGYYFSSAKQCYSVTIFNVTIPESQCLVRLFWATVETRRHNMVASVKADLLPMNQRLLLSQSKHIDSFQVITPWLELQGS